MTITALTVYEPDGEIVHTGLEQAGQTANYVAAKHAFSDYQSRKSANTLQAQFQALESFADFLLRVGVETGDLFTEPRAWRGVTWGLVEAFVKSLLSDGYSISTVKHRLSIVKVYSKLATKAGVIEPQELTMIRTVSGYSGQEAKHIDEKRTQTRRGNKGNKKAQWTAITREQADLLKQQPDTPQGRRDAVIMAILIEHGLRVSELVRLTVGDVDIEQNELRFYRPKTNESDQHHLTPDSRKALQAYVKQDALAVGPLLRGSRKDGRLHEAGMSERAVNARVKALGQSIGIDNLSPHDLRHYGATELARNKTPLDRLQAWGGWHSYSMPLRYIKRATHGNEGCAFGK